MKYLAFLALLISSSEALQIGCNFYNNSYWADITPVYTCNVASFSAGNNSFEITEVTGTHQSGLSNFNVESFYWQCSGNSTTNAIPKKLLRFFPNLRRIQFQNCPFEALNGNELEEYPNIEYLSIYIAKLTTIPSNFFKATPNMKVIDFDNNKIEKIPQHLITNVFPNMQKLDFRRNICINQYASIPTQIPAFLSVMTQNCSYVEPTTVASVDDCGDLQTQIDSLAYENDLLVQKVVNLTTQLGTQAAEMQKKDLEIGQLKYDNAILKANCQQTF